MKGKIALAAVLAVTSGAALAGGAGSAHFKDLDQNGDGYVSKEEARKMPGLYEQWTRADANQDGRLDQSEFAQVEITGEAGEESAE